NWSPARVFMGDVGSTWLGAVFAGLVLQQRQPAQAVELLLVALPLLADPLVCVLRRLADGQPVFQAHRLHLFQRLQQAGWGHRQVASLYGGGTAALALALLWGGGGALLALAAGELAMGVGLDRRWALSFGEASAAQRSRRSQT
ncbi:MAG: glycosyl transferase, partial [Cyanobium sp.]